MTDAVRDEVGRVREWYNLVADVFVRRYDGEAGWYFERCEEDLLHAVCPCAGRDVLDLGTGGGRLLPRLSALARRVVGADISEALLSRAPRAHRMALLQMDALDPALRPQSFDVVVSLGLFEYVEDLDRFLAAIASVLRPGGRLAFTYHQIAAYRQARDEAFDAPYFGRTVGERSRYWSKRRHHRGTVHAALGRAGFEAVRGYRLFFRAPRVVFGVGSRFAEGSARRRLLRRAVPALERFLARRLRLLTQFSTGNVLIVATRAAQSSAATKETSRWR
jgi:2-polyprenyl-3-methyl-5-hydroxy-6-metoxy-1,4-benzoquinol methylase